MESMSNSTNERASTLAFNGFVDACVKQGNLKAAWVTLEFMDKLEVPKDSFTYSSIIKGLNKPFHSQELMKVLKTIETLESQPDFKADEILYNVLIDACIKCRDLPSALKVFERIRKPESPVTPDEITYNTIIKGCAINRKITKAFEVFE